ncbi:Restriction endonuclease S subunit, putative fragment [Alteracholeplasma palmae J233]|uniref:Restriction endonuclease S subunit, putative n=1 Tax=Alteracholeplasma palmae (strain ATCC 49389 / J233) TaxID=1318466 RepID=U4KK47_ALTPJ|nr:restriction endonuclease subunit S [Alteracholeplasma palmae]CCV63892.1 Restriction endonuclease S subunit, putative fragment [Alteracholeplasma palmae J233]
MYQIRRKLILNVPHLRFPEFTGEWRSISLNKFAQINNHSTKLEEYFHYIDLESVEKGVLLNQKTINKNEAPSRAQRVLTRGDILYQTVRPYQFNNLFFDISSGEQYVASTGYAVLRTKENPRFLYHLMNTPTFNKKVMLRSTGTSYPAINSTDLSTIKIMVPSIPEQDKISELLTLIDKKIEVQRKLIDLYKSLIKSLNDDLYYATSEDIFKLKNIILPLQTKEIINDNYLEIGDINILTGTYRVDPNKKYVFGAQKGYCNNLIISTIRPNRGAVTILKEDIMISSALLQLNIVKNYSLKFIKEYLRMPKVLHDFSNLSFGSAYPTISKSDLINYKIPRLESIEFELKSRIVSRVSDSLDYLHANIKKHILLKEYMLKKLFI